MDGAGTRNSRTRVGFPDPGSAWWAGEVQEPRFVSDTSGGARAALLALRRVGEERRGFAGTEQGQQRQEHRQEGEKGRGGGARRRDV